jgi:hypothetical protein
MSLAKRGGIWWIDVVSPNGQRIRRSTGTSVKALAQEYHDRTKAELWRIAKLGEKPSSLLKCAALSSRSHSNSLAGDVPRFVELKL